MNSVDKLTQLLSPYVDAAAECFYLLVEQNQKGFTIDFKVPQVIIKDDKFFFDSNYRSYQTFLDLFETVAVGALMIPTQDNEVGPQWCIIKPEEHQLRKKISRPIFLEEVSYGVEVKSAHNQLLKTKTEDESWISFLSSLKLKDFLKEDTFEFSLSFKQESGLESWEKLSANNVINSLVFMYDLNHRYNHVAKLFYPEDQESMNDRVTAWLLSAGLPAPRSKKFEALSFWSDNIFIAEKVVDIFASKVISPDYVDLKPLAQINQHIDQLKKSCGRYEVNFHSGWGPKNAGFYLSYLRGADVD